MDLKLIIIIILFVIIISSYKKDVVMKPIYTFFDFDRLIDERDTNVVYNDLYPPLNRPTKPIASDYLMYKTSGLFDVKTRYSDDTFRLIGYLINSNNKNEKWNLFGRQKYSGSSQGDFYVVQQCNSNGPCTKIDLNDDILTSGRIRDYYNLPNKLTFNSPLFDVHPYDVIQLKTTYDYSPYI